MLILIGTVVLYLAIGVWFAKANAKKIQTEPNMELVFSCLVFWPIIAVIFYFCELVEWVKK